MAKKKTPRTIVPVANPSASGKGKRLPKKPLKIFFNEKGVSKYHN